MDPKQFSAGLAHFTGSETLTRHGMMRNLLLTEGAVYVAEKGAAWWLIDAIASHMMTNPALREDVMVWTFDKNGVDAKGRRCQVLKVTDGNYKVLAHQYFSDSTFPIDKIEMNAERAYEHTDRPTWVLMLPSEH